MKRIFLAPKGKRMLAWLIDTLLTFGFTALIYFTCVYPFSFNQDEYVENNKQQLALYRESQLFVTTPNGTYGAKSMFTDDINTVEKLSGAYFMYEGRSYEANVSKDLFTFYTTDINNRYTGGVILTPEEYMKKVLNVNALEESSSNIKALDYEDNTFKIHLFNEEHSSKTLAYFFNAYEIAAGTVRESPLIKTLEKRNYSMILNTILYVIPVLIGSCFIFSGAIPFCAKHGQSIGKFITHLIVLTSNGNRANKFAILFRWVIYALELLLGIVTFGGVLLIPYTMFLFTKKRQALHDMVSSTVVANGRESIFFETQKEEAYFINKMKEQGDESVYSGRDSAEE